MSKITQETRFSPQPVLLGFLMFGPRHPYELYQEFNRELGRVWYIGQSHFYAYLKQLAESGLATVKTEAQASRPPRHVYYLTPAGRDAFLAWLHQPAQHARHIRLEFLARLYFFRRLSLPGLEQLVAAQKTLLQPRIESLRCAAAEADDDFWRLVLEFRRGEMEAIVSWLERCLEESQAA
jgi:PadR family transcriptional regulator, regulatory protein AphA